MIKSTPYRYTRLRSLHPISPSSTATKYFWLLLEQVAALLHAHPGEIFFTAGQTVPHAHIHLIPRYSGDIENPTGGVRNIIPGLGDYTDLRTQGGSVLMRRET